MNSIKNLYLSADKSIKRKTDGQMELSNLIIAILLTSTLIYLA